MYTSTCFLLLSLIAILLTLASTAAAPTYSEETAKYAVDFSGAAYCAGTLGGGADEWSCKACRQHPEVTNVTIITASSLTETFNGYVAFDSSTNQIVLSIAGTDPLNIKEWIDDLNFFKTNYDLCEEYGDSKCEVHQGFLAAYDLAKEEVRVAIHEYVNAFPTATVMVTGHSLGAALAVLAALDLQLTQGINIETVYTFGQPRIGDKNFAEFAVDNLMEFRLTHYQDPVPHLPPQKLLLVPFFHHPSTEVFYSQLNSLGDYKVCTDPSGEDKKCSNKFLLDVNIFNHLDYVGFNFIDNYLDCKF